jgi:hypothetical protein
MHLALKQLENDQAIISNKGPQDAHYQVKEGSIPVNPKMIASVVPEIGRK